MNLFEKLLDIQCSIDRFIKDNTIGEGKAAYKAVGSEQVLNEIRPLMNSHKLLLEPSVEAARVQSDKTSSGTTRYFTEIDMVMTWIDVESGQERQVKWYGQGVDLAGEKGVGKANTYAEKYFLMKYFHVPTPKDDPDGDSRTKSGELKQRGTQAAAETAGYQRKAMKQMLAELYEGDAEKIKGVIVSITKNESRQYPGVDSVEAISDVSLPINYDKVKKSYVKRTGKEFKLTEDAEDAG
jgi:hypothetical protein